MQFHKNKLFTVSPPCNAVQMIAKVLNVQLNLKHIDLFAKDHPTPEFVKVNPQHTIPTLVDNDFVLWESRVILAYLVEKYGRNDSLYPKDPKKRAVVNQRLYFDMDTLYESFELFYNPQIFSNQPADPELLVKLEKAVELFELFLSSSTYVAGDHATIADYSIIASISPYAELYDFSRFKNVTRWFELCSSLPGIEINNESLKAIKKLIEEFSVKN